MAVCYQFWKSLKEILDDVESKGKVIDNSLLGVLTLYDNCMFHGAAADGGKLSDDHEHEPESDDDGESDSAPFMVSHHAKYFYVLEYFFL